MKDREAPLRPERNGWLAEFDVAAGSCKPPEGMNTISPAVDNTPFFIIGSGRSGTTLLRLILAGHSRLHILPETWFLLDLVEALPLQGALTPEEVAQSIDIMTTHYRWPDMEVTVDDLHRWAAALPEPSLADIAGYVYRRHLEIAGKPRFGDKTPVYFQIVPQLAELFPGAKFIHLMRDGHDVAMSWIDLGYERYYERPGFEWTAVMQTRRTYVNCPHWQQILEVKYEELVAEPEGTTRRICGFLGEEFEPAMLDWQERTDLVPERERSIHPKLGQPISSDGIGRWKTRLSALECFAIEACLHRDLRQLGYPLRFRGAAWRPFLDAAGWTLYAMAPLLGRGTRYLRRRNLLPRMIYI
jgi:hypothetical protein